MYKIVIFPHRCLSLNINEAKTKINSLLIYQLDANDFFSPFKYWVDKLNRFREVISKLIEPNKYYG